MSKKSFKIYTELAAKEKATKAKKSYHKFKFKKSDILLFGRESAGVPEVLHSKIKNK